MNAGLDAMRSALAFLRAQATNDTEARRVLVAHSDLEALAVDLADIALLFMGYLNGDPVQHLDLMFRALDEHRREADFDESGSGQGQEPEVRQLAAARCKALTGLEALALINARKSDEALDDGGGSC